MPVSPGCQGCEAGLCFCFFETNFLVGTEKGKDYKQTTAPKKELQDTERNRVSRKFTKAPPTTDPVELGKSLGRRTMDIGQHSQ